MLMANACRLCYFLLRVIPENGRGMTYTTAMRSICVIPRCNYIMRNRIMSRSRNNAINKAFAQQVHLYDREKCVSVYN